MSATTSENRPFEVTIDAVQGVSPKDPIQIPIGPVTRARAKKFKEALNGLIQEVCTQIQSRKPIDGSPREELNCINLIQVLEDFSPSQT